MKKFLYYTILATVLFACSKPVELEPEPKPIPQDPITLVNGVDTKPVLKRAAGETKISFNATENWTATIPNAQSLPWISLDKTSGGAGPATITVKVAENNTTEERSAKIQIKAGAKTIELLVTQKGYSVAVMPNYWYLLPNGVDKSQITEVHFYTASEVVTSNIVGATRDGAPRIFFELKGTVANYYTEGDYYELEDGFLLFQEWISLKSLDLSMFHTEKVKDMSLMFDNCRALEYLDISSFNTESVTNLSGMFQRCKSLRSIDISHFSSKNFHRQADESGSTGITGLFGRCYSLTNIDLGNLDLSGCEAIGAMTQVAKYSKNCAVRCSAATRAQLCGPHTNYKYTNDYITWFLPEEDLPVFEPKGDPSLYCSTDFSKDKIVRVLHKATKGNGVNIALMGDAYSDRMIADGTYDKDMELAMAAIFKDEPYASFKDYFNVFSIYAVSQNEIPNERTVFDASILDVSDYGTEAYQEQDIVHQYAKIAFPNSDLENIAMIIIINAGTTPSPTDGVAGISGKEVPNEYPDYPAHAIAIGMINRRDRSQTLNFSLILSHEFGHVFAQLYDEYSMWPGQMEDWEKEQLLYAFAHNGWWSNVDFTNDPQTIKWSKYLADERYAGTGIGIFEGGGYSQGIWHPSQSSIMNQNVNGFNAPSREAIYKKIHKLALGKDWQFDYEKFVEYDKINIEADKARINVTNQVTKALPTHKPFFKYNRQRNPDGTTTINVIMD